MMAELVHLEVAGASAPSRSTRRKPQRAVAAGRRRPRPAAHRGARDPGVRVVVLTGTGSVFCSGADLKERRTAEPAPASGRPSGVVPILTAMWHAPKPIVGRINGAARAGGLGLVAACDIAVAPETATFALSEVRIGVVPATIAVVLVPKIGQSRAMELCLTGDVFDGRAAVAMASSMPRPRRGSWTRSSIATCRACSRARRRRWRAPSASCGRSRRSRWTRLRGDVPAVGALVRVRGSGRGDGGVRGEARAEVDRRRRLAGSAGAIFSAAVTAPASASARRTSRRAP